MPPKWVVRDACADLPRGQVWDGVMSNVSAARFYVGDPDVSYEPLTWDIGFDNARITLGKFGAPPASNGTAVPGSALLDPTD